jgi:signal peptidase II
MMQNRRPLFLIAAVVIIAAIAVFYRRIKEEGTLPVVSVGLLLGGAVGNLIDRMLVGKVTDFIDVRIWPVFNVADSAIFVGVAVLVYFMVFLSKPDRECNKATDMSTEKRVTTEPPAGTS